MSKQTQIRSIEAALGRLEAAVEKACLLTEDYASRMTAFEGDVIRDMSKLQVEIRQLRAEFFLHEMRPGHEQRDEP
jgi:hypothetical protein